MQITKKFGNGHWFTWSASLALATFTQLASGQSSVTVYGIVDAGLMATRTGAPGTGTVTGVGSGINAASRWGFRGTEDLGDGLKASFVLEAGFDLDTGAMNVYAGNPSTATPAAPNGTTGTGFNRKSSVSLEGSWGTLGLGRDYTPFFYAGLDSDIFRYGMFGNLQVVAPLAGGVERFGRISNAVFYTSPAINGFRARAAYSFGSESAGGAGNLPKRSNEFIGVGAEYRNSGLVLLSSYQELTYPVVAGSPLAFTGATSRRRDAMLGAKYTIGALTVSGGAWKVGAPQNATDSWIGAAMNFGASTVLGQIQSLRQDNPSGAERKGTVLGLGYVYSLSPRTALYASYGQVSNGNTAAFPLLSSSTVLAAGGPGADPKATGFGIRHSF